MAPGSVSPLAVEVAKNQWAGFHLAAADVHQHLPGTADGEDGEDLPRPDARGKEPEGIARINQAAALEIPAGGQRRPPGRLGCGGRSDSAAAHHPVKKVTGPFLGRGAERPKTPANSSGVRATTGSSLCIKKLLQAFWSTRNAANISPAFRATKDP